MVLEFDFRIILIATIILAVSLFIGITQQKRLKAKSKKIIFAAIVFTVLLVTGYLVAITAYWDIISESKGPVHWHADFDVWICGENLEMPHSRGLEGEGNVGTEILHHHNDNRIHVEGILIKLEDYDLQHFFQAIGGDLTSTSISIPQSLPPNPNSRIYKNGDLCLNGQSAFLKVFVNGKQVENPGKHQVAPLSQVPPGDRIKIVFDEKSLEKVNTNLGEAP